MAVELWIDDGDPWYLSPDIWVVPSDDPNDPPAMPFEGVSAYVWSEVENRGSTPVASATVRFYWADPSTAITRSTATLIGTSSVSLAAGETKNVLCVTPWIPQIVNNGHECLIAEAFAAADPLPPHGPNDPFNVPTDRHVAQRNITVGMAAASMMFVHPFVMGGAGGRSGARRWIRAHRAPITTLKPLVRTMGLRRLPREAPEIKAIGIQPYRCGDAAQEVGDPEQKVELRVGDRRGMALVVRIPDGFPQGAGALLLVEQLVDDDVVGGVAVLVLPAGGGGAGRPSGRTSRDGDSEPRGGRQPGRRRE